MKRTIKKTLLIIISILMSFCLCSCNSENESLKINNLDELDGLKIGILTGSVSEDFVKERLSNAELLYFTSVGDLTTAVIENKVDAIVYDAAQAKNIVSENDELTYLNESVGEFSYGAIFNLNNTSLRDDYNNFINSLEESKELSLIQNRWFNTDEIISIDYESLENINGVLTVAINATDYPMIFTYNNDYTGLELEIAYLYCKDRGLKLEFKAYDFAGVLAAVSANKADIGIASISATDERKEQFNFSREYATGNLIAVLRKENVANEINNIDDLEGKTIGVLTGSVGDNFVKNYFKDVNVKYYNTSTDLIESLLNNKIDAFAKTSNEITDDIKQQYNLKDIGSIGEENYGLILPKNEKGEALKAELDEFIINNKDILNRIFNNWYEDETNRNIDLDSLTGERGTITFGVCSLMGEPTTYLKDEKYEGREITFIYEFAKAYNYKVEIVDYTFDSLLQAVSASRIDVGGCNITITDEREESLLFSIPYNTGYCDVYIKDTSVMEDEDFFSSIIDSFNKTFIKESRYLLFVDGIKVTLLISFFSIIFGLILGILLFVIYLKKNKVINFILDKLGSLIGEMPTTVLLMIFYYVIFKTSTLDSMWMAVISFTVAFGFVNMNLLNTSLYAIDKGQFDGAYALGYSHFETYKRVVIPQIIPIFMPLFKGEVVSLIKSTSVVGYIAVQDLTKVSDIVRTRTYEAFFPLIATTIIYVLIILAFKKIIDLIGNKLNFEKSNKEEFLKGVKR